ncbi:MAG: hypothetical protein JSV78_04555 [Phycisphaerales bacterium]|nr:MAG: hypothetical protein JSV78_04555 [Phycisphaerales bacterium]
MAEALKAQPDLSRDYPTPALLEINRRAEAARLATTASALHKLPLKAVEDSVAEVLKVRDLTYPLDEIVSKARRATSEYYKGKLATTAGGAPIVKRNMTAVVAKVTKRLNARGLEDIERLLLALPAVYEQLLIDALDKEKINPQDDQGLFDYVLRSVRVEPRHYLLNEIVGAALGAENIKLEKDELSALRDLAFQRGISLRDGTVRSAVRKLLADAQSVGNLRQYVDRYAARGEIDTAQFDESIKSEMARFLFARGVTIPSLAAFESGNYDEYFALAFDHALRVSEGSNDPVDVARTKGAGGAEWDYTIRRISESDRPIIRAELIRAAGALYTTFIEGEQMYVYDIADSLLTAWHRGELDIPDGDAASQLNRYEILMRDRPTEEERQMHYKRVFNIGDAEMLSGTVVNETFPSLWDNLMYEVTRYIDKIERYYTEEKFISRTYVYQAIQDLQYNLSEYMTGSTPKKTAEMYHHLQEALDIIGSDDVLNHVGGRRKSILAAIEHIGKASLGVAIPAKNLVEMAERGNDIFRFIANFAPENVADDEFQRFLDACKACIVNQAALEPRREDEGNGDEFESNGYRNGNGYATARRRTHRNGNRVGGRNNGGNFDDWES